MKQEFETVIIGGGAAGLMAAVSAAQRGDSVVVLEANVQLGRKILVSGNGRCNLTNIDGDNVSHFHGSNPRFIGSVLEQLPVNETLALFDDLGVVTKQEKRGRLFPQSDQARSIVDVLEDRVVQLGGQIATQARIEQLDGGDGGYEVRSGDGRLWRGDRVIMASGGISVPKLGADDSGLQLVEKLGHSRTSLYPGLVALNSDNPQVHRMQGLKVWAQVSAPLSSGRVVVDTDDLLFAKYGVSGFTILNLSAVLVDELRRGPVELSVNVLPGHSVEEVSALLKTRWERNPRRSLELSFAGLLSTKLTRPLLEGGGFERESVVQRISKAQRWQLSQLLTDWRIMVTGPRPFEYAEVTIGGVHNGEIDAQTLESYITPGLYLTGEMIDVHGDLGGFNFQWAWSSGWVAGRRLGS
jgi:predicted Rossmann fold flavoprotein